MLRTAKLTVDDEIENALSYYRATFLRPDPASSIARSRRRCRATTIASFFRMGNWIGGDRDGNPFVDAGTLRAAFAQQSETALRHYLTQVHELGAELSISATLQPVTPEMQRARRRSPATPARIARTSRTGAR